MRPEFFSRRNWSARSIFKDIHFSGWKNPGINEIYRDYFLADFYAEYDAINLYTYLHSRRQEFSPRFIQYLDIWLTDERNHADGFHELLKLIFDIDEQSLFSSLSGREPDFSPFHEILSTEFNVLIMFAYDEYASVKTYKKDTFYAGFGHPLFETWINNLIADEALHFGNAIKMLKTYRPQKLCQAREILVKISELEKLPYKNTFLLDHDGPHFQLHSSETGDAITNKIMSILGQPSK